MARIPQDLPARLSGGAVHDGGRSLREAAAPSVALGISRSDIRATLTSDPWQLPVVHVRSGLDRLAAGDGPSLRGRPVSLLCHPAAVDRSLRGARDVLVGCGANIVSLLGPEHGVDAAAQDMEGVDDDSARATGEAAATPTYSLYGDTYESLFPTPAMFHGAEWLVCDLQDVGSRYYTYVWTIAMAAEVALRAGLRVLVLDRPNPLGGLDEAVEGGAIEPGQESFVGYHDVAVRHGMTVAELVSMTLTERGVPSLDRLVVLECDGWRRNMMAPEAGLPWVLPSPNMPTFDTAVVYPGQCLLEGTNLSEGRGTTRPFEICGAPFLDGATWAAAISEDDLPGLRLRPLNFRPTFQKHAGTTCGGIQLHVMSPSAVRSLRTTWALLAAAWRLSKGAMRWRTERYEFVEDRPALDLLAGGAWLRAALEAGTPAHELVAAQEAGRQRFLERRRRFLRYSP